MRIGLYDGSFDPAYYGHVETVRAAVQAARLDLVVLTCHPQPSASKPELSRHDLRTRMLASYLDGDLDALVSSLPRAQLLAQLAPHRIVGIIGSDTFNRFLLQGVAPDFQTDEIFVSERWSDPLHHAPVSLGAKQVWCIGRSQLAQNRTCSRAIRNALANPNTCGQHQMLNPESQRIALDNNLYSARTKATPAKTQHVPYTYPTPDLTIPAQYHGCEIVRRAGLENGLLSESCIFEVRHPTTGTIVYMRTLPPHRDPR